MTADRESSCLDPAFFKHEIRTLLNHIAGYGEILKEDAEDYGHPDLAALFSGIHGRAMELKATLSRRFAGNAALDTDALKRELAPQVSRVAAEVAGARAICAERGLSQFQNDSDRILASANNVLELFDCALPAPSWPAAFASLPDAPAEAPALRGTILVVDDNDYNRDILARYLERLGHRVLRAEGGKAALGILQEERIDLVMLDYMMPLMNGYEVLERIRADASLRETPVIMISMMDRAETVARCIQLGAEDFLPKEFDPALLKARIASCLERKARRGEREKYLSRVIEAQRRITAELTDAAHYIQSLLPPPLSEKGVTASWLFIPSTSLGGDIFGYHWLDDDRFAVYLIDVSGHGVEAALLSVTLMNILKAQALADTDYADPVSVLGRLNSSFRIEEQNNMFFSVWYGVYDRRTRNLRFSSGGSSPAIVFNPDESARELSSGDMILGVDPGAEFHAVEFRVPPGTHLYLFSDGVYEIRKKDGKILGLADFIGILRSQRKTDVGAIIEAVKAVSTKEQFEDDVSLVHFTF